MNTGRSNAVRHMSRAEAANEARRLAQKLIASTENDRWVFTIANVSPCMIDPRPVGKTPSRWIVGTRCDVLDSPDSVIDGGDATIVVDLLTETACFSDF